MPLYEYQCDSCGHNFETIQKFSDAPLEACPKCGGALRKLQSAPAFQFKGTGWYITDYAKKDGGKGAKTGEAAASKEAPKEGAKTDSTGATGSGSTGGSSTAPATTKS